MSLRSTKVRMDRKNMIAAQAIVSGEVQALTFSALCPPVCSQFYRNEILASLNLVCYNIYYKPLKIRTFELWLLGQIMHV